MKCNHNGTVTLQAIGTDIDGNLTNVDGELFQYTGQADCPNDVGGTSFLTVSAVPPEGDQLKAENTVACTLGNLYRGNILVTDIDSGTDGLTTPCCACDVSGGPSWQPSLTGSHPAFSDGVLNNGWRVFAHPTNGSIVYATTVGVPESLGFGGGAFADGLWRTSDGGASWEKINEATTGDPALDFTELTSDTGVFDLAFCPEDPSSIVAATLGKGFFRSSDGGDTWSYISSSIFYTPDSADHCPEIASPTPQTFETQGGGWAAVTAAFAPGSSCLTIYGGILGIPAPPENPKEPIDIIIDSPGVFRTTDGGASWTGLRNGLPSFVDALDCHPLTLTLEASAPGSLRVNPANGQVLMALLDVDIDARPLIFGEKEATTQARVYELVGDSWTEVSNGLQSTETTQIAAALLDLAAINASLPLISVSPNGAFWLLSHINLAGRADFVDIDFFSRAGGVYGSQDGRNWIAIDPGIPVVHDVSNENAQNVGTLSIRPTDVKFWAVGTFLSDTSGPDSSAAYITPNFGAAWFADHATPLAVSGLESSPVQGIPQSNILSIEWSGDGKSLYAMVGWGDTLFNAEDDATVDDGVYQVQLFP